MRGRGTASRPVPEVSRDQLAALRGLADGKGGYWVLPRPGELDADTSIRRMNVLLSLTEKHLVYHSQAAPGIGLRLTRLGRKTLALYQNVEL